MFILSEQRAPMGYFEPYLNYLKDNQDRFPKSAYSLATSEWYFDFGFSGCPHDAWLEKITISEPSSGKRSEERSVEINIELLGAWHDGIISLRYPRVFGYKVEGWSLWEGLSLAGGHHDWRFDEFRLNDDGNLIHEIEWMGFRSNGRWIIEATDVEYNWRPFQEGILHTNRPSI